MTKSFFNYRQEEWAKLFNCVDARVSERHVPSKLENLRQVITFFSFCFRSSNQIIPNKQLNDRFRQSESLLLMRNTRITKLNVRNALRIEENERNLVRNTQLEPFFFLLNNDSN